jgi:hypothetical protein
MVAVGAAVAIALGTDVGLGVAVAGISVGLGAVLGVLPAVGSVIAGTVRIGVCANA